MKNPENRDVMTRLYRMIEKYETPPKVEYLEDALEYFKQALSDCVSVHDSYKGNAFASCFSFALYEALERRFKEVNPNPLKDKPEQVGMF